MFVDNVNQVMARLRELKVIPVLVLEDLDNAMRLFEILESNGLPAAEITFRTQAAESIIKEASKNFPDMLVGAGTVLTIDNLGRAADAGAKFAVAPGFNPVVVEAAIKKDFPFMPGVATPSEIEQAMNMGLRNFKFFPAEALGGVSYLKNIGAPYRHLGLSFIPTGGLNPTNFDDYLKLPEVVACGGTWLGRAEDIKAGNWKNIKAAISDTVKLASE